ncbi:MAG: hypothetical protein KDC44_22470 [Phaeodactylibacter sp.]|nr:hypothetical protein [Phaeodactylibacter sp.]
MKKNAIPLILFALLGTATAWYFLTGSEAQKTTLKDPNREFAVQDIDRIQKIFMADRRGRQTTLERKGADWIVNGQGKANPNILNNLLQVIRRVEIQFIPPTTATEPIVQDLSTNGIKVELYDGKSEPFKVYYVGGTTPDERGTYMIMEGADQPYVTHLPSVSGGLRVRYNIWGENWRDKTVFAYKPGEIAFVSIEYPNFRSKSFQLYAGDKSYEVEPFYDITPGDRKAVPSGLAQSYLLGFERVVAEAFENENNGRDSIAQQLPFAIITVKTKTGAEKVVELNPLDQQRVADKFAATPIERYFAEVRPPDDFMMVQHHLFAPILRPLEFFLQES